MKNSALNSFGVRLFVFIGIHSVYLRYLRRNTLGDYKLKEQRMAKKKLQRDWGKAQPHDASTGLFVTRKKANASPKKVEWVTVKKGKKRG